MTTVDLLRQLHKLGVVMTPHPDGRVCCRARKGVLTPVLVDAMRQHKTELHALAEEWCERAAITEYDGRIPRAEAEQVAGEYVLRKKRPAHLCP